MDVDVDVEANLMTELPDTKYEALTHISVSVSVSTVTVTAAVTVMVLTLYLPVDTQS